MAEVDELDERILVVSRSLRDLLTEVYKLRSKNEQLKMEIASLRNQLAEVKPVPG